MSESGVEEQALHSSYEEDLDAEGVVFNQPLDVCVCMCMLAVVTANSYG